MERIDKMITPIVNQVNIFKEICANFSNPLEIFREAISNAYDAKADNIWIKIYKKNDTVIIAMKDDGNGMDYDTILNNFWNLGSTSKNYNLRYNDKSIIGEKGHGSKIYLKSSYVQVITKTPNGKAYKSECKNPQLGLENEELPKIDIKELDDIKEFVKENHDKGTIIKIENYNNNDKTFNQNMVKDYIKWFTKAGSFEKKFEKNDSNKEIKVYLNCFEDKYEEIKFGHEFPTKELINDFKEKRKKKIINETEEDLKSEYFWQNFIYQNEPLPNDASTKIDIFISVESNLVKRSYNKQIVDRLQEKSKEKGKYKIIDRYGIWICKDYIPIQRVNSFIADLGSSSYIMMMHGFVNCQDINLTANRCSFSNTRPELIDDIKEVLNNKVKDILEDLSKENGYYKLLEEEKRFSTAKEEDNDFKIRIKQIQENRNILYTTDNGIKILKPTNEGETILFFQQLYMLNPDYFDFEILDYSTSRGIDMIAKSKKSDDLYFYIEFKYRLNKKGFNHSFSKLKYIICYDISIKDGEYIYSNLENKYAILEVKNSKNSKIYSLVLKDNEIKIPIIKLKDIKLEDFFNQSNFIK